MAEEPFDTRDEVRLPFQPGDRFIQVHANGAILVVADDYQWNLATAGQAVAVALEAIENGTRSCSATRPSTIGPLPCSRRCGAPEPRSSSSAPSSHR